MPKKYHSNAELPDDVRDALPKHGQEIYREAFNSAYDEYEDPEERRDPDDSREEVAHKVAWSAVKKEYERVEEGEWKRKASA